MQAMTPTLYRALLREDFYLFIHRCHEQLNPGSNFLPNWHIEVMAAKLDAVRRGTLRRLIINLPPRHLKSLCASVALPAYWLGHKPSRTMSPRAEQSLSQIAREITGAHWSGPRFFGWKRASGTSVALKAFGHAQETR